MILDIRNVNKEYVGFSKLSERFLSAITLGFFRPRSTQKALSGITLSADKKEIIGIIGKNGAGKSTLLKLISRSLEPSEGVLNVNGSVRSILELGIGMHADLSVAENVYYTGILWGYTPQRLKLGIEEVLQFAGLPAHATTDFRTLSTGMQMRVAFSLATLERSDILLVDEALAVGDAAFQQKCINRFREFAEAGSLVVVVSHDLHMLSAVCSRILILDNGKLVFDGKTEEATEYYMKVLSKPILPLRESDQILPVQIQLLDDLGKERNDFIAGESAMVAVSFILPEGNFLEDGTIGLHIRNRAGILVFGTNSRLLGHGPFSLKTARQYRAEFPVCLNLGAGGYTLGCAIHKGYSHAEGSIFREETQISFQIESRFHGHSEGVADLSAKFRLYENQKNITEDISSHPAGDFHIL